MKFVVINFGKDQRKDIVNVNEIKYFTLLDMEGSGYAEMSCNHHTYSLSCTKERHLDFLSFLAREDSTYFQFNDSEVDDEIKPISNWNI